MLEARLREAAGGGNGGGVLAGAKLWFERGCNLSTRAYPLEEMRFRGGLIGIAKLPFEGAGNLQDAGLVKMIAEDLHADRKAGFGLAARD